MFTKRIKYIRDFYQEIDILFKKSDREISKLNENLASEVKKKLRKFSPGVQIKIRKIEEIDFRRKQKRTLPIVVLIESINGRKLHKNGFWVQEIWQDDTFSGFIKTENILTRDQLEDTLFELSEELGLKFEFQKVDGKVIY